MPDEKKDQPKMVPEKDLIALKERLRKTEEKAAEAAKRLADLTASNATLERQLKTAKANLEDDDEVKEVREYLMQHDAEVSQKAKDAEARDTSLKERERKVRARELVADYKAKGLELTEDGLLSAEDMETYAKDSHAEFQAKEIERLKNQPQAGSPEGVFESGRGGVVKKQPKDMTDAEFDAHWQSLQAGALSKK